MTPEAVRDALRINPHLTINLLASQLDSTVDEVAQVLDEWEVLGDGSLRHNGPGQGGGWLNEEDRMSVVDVSGPPEHVGFRWPDGSIRSDQYIADEPEAGRGGE
jgi:hypothetical protein